MKTSVLQLIDSFQCGGTESQAVHLSSELNSDGRFKVFVACLDREGELRERITWLDDRELPEFKLTSFYDANFFRQIQRCVRFIKQQGIQIVHTHDFYTNVFGMLAAFLAGVPVRVASRRETTGTRNANQKRLERAAYRTAHAIVANSQAVRDQLELEGVSGQKIPVIYNGLDLDAIGREDVVGGDSRRLEILGELGLLDDETSRFVTIVANLRLNVKDHPTFLRSARRVHDAIPSAKFVLAGEGPLLESMRTLAVELGIGEATVFLGKCDRVADLLAVSDVCVLSSKAEGFSNSILEYMAAGRPSVVTDVGGARETITDGETGYLVDSGDDVAMGARIISLLQSPEKARLMGERAQNSVRDRFSLTEQLRRTIDLYDSLLQKRLRRISVQRIIRSL